jgi:cell division protein FtsB
VVVLMLSAAFPLQEYLQQRAEISELQDVRDDAQERVSALEQERRRLQDPAFIAAEARRRLHFVLPGETAYVLVDQPPALAEAGAPAGREAPWFSQVWGSVREADRPSAP